MTTAVDLLSATRAELMKPNGWCQGHFGEQYAADGAVCLSGALTRSWARVRSGRLADSDPLAHAWNALSEELVARGYRSGIFSFNDEASSLNEVLGLVDDALATLKESA